ncbi:MAG: metal ABC transporter permease [Chloroflexi bacterium]|nr:metal ABC transporter permease [Chloroflexota bacterium]
MTWCGSTAFPSKCSTTAHTMPTAKTPPATTGSTSSRPADSMPAILQYEFMVRALIGGVLVGALAPVLGTFLVLRRFSLFSDTLAHVALFGVAAGFALNVYPTLTTFVTVAIAAVVMEVLRSRGRLPGDAVLAVALYSSLAAAVVVISAAQGFNVDLLSFLFGSILTITELDLWLLVGLAVFVIIGVTAFFTELAQTSFDDALARVSGIKVDWVNLGLAVLAAATITLAMRIMGVLLVGALIVIPVLVGQGVTNSLRTAIIVSSIVGIISAVTGLTLAFYQDIPGGGAIVLVAVAMLVLSIAWRRFRRRSS